MRRVCSQCNREEPTYIHSPYCEKGTYCNWVAPEPVVALHEISTIKIVERLMRYADDIESEGRSCAPAIMREAARRLEGSGPTQA